MPGRPFVTDRRLFQIGEVAKLFHVSVGTLRHYEKLGLIQPEVIDPATGYRYYASGQFEVLNTIRYLRALQMPLEEIGDFLKNREPEMIEEKLLHQKELIREKREELERIERQIDHRLDRLREAREGEQGLVREVTLPGMRLVRIRDSLSPKSYLDLEESLRKLEAGQEQSLVFLGKVGLGIGKEHLKADSFETYDTVFLILDPEDPYRGEVEILPEGQYLQVRFRGSHPQAKPYYRMLLDHVREEKLQISGFSQEITLVDEGLTDDPEKFVTEIRLPVSRSGIDHQK